jgi:hypothetical protein
MDPCSLTPVGFDDAESWRVLRTHQVRARQLFHCYISDADDEEDPGEESDDAYLAYYDDAAAADD